MLTTPPKVLLAITRHAICHQLHLPLVLELDQDINAFVANGVEQGHDFIGLNVDDLHRFAGVQDAVIQDLVTVW